MNNNMIKVQHQIWKDRTTDLIFEEGGTVHLDIYDEPISLIYPVKSYIYCLYVDEDKRKQGIATRLLQKAEQLAKEAGMTEVYLDYNKVVPNDILEWYIRNGYKPLMENSDDTITLVKQL